jgi:4,5-DOPA dioxygenase extradiol
MPLPIYFISHGAPDLILRDAPASRFMKGFSLPLEEAKAILVISAHWETEAVAVTASELPGTMHDFYGFPEELYRVTYPVKGDRGVAERIVALLRTQNITATLDNARGLDHGAWMPLILMAPKLALPVLQISIQPHHTPEQHYRLGQALATLRQEGVIIMGSGNITHNIRAALHQHDNTAVQYAQAFDSWAHDALMKRDDDRLLRWKEEAPHAAWNHPTNDHILPLFVTLGASIGEPTQRIHHSFDYGVLSMGAYRFG